MHHSRFIADISSKLKWHMMDIICLIILVTVMLVSKVPLSIARAAPSANDLRVVIAVDGTTAACHIIKKKQDPVTRKLIQTVSSCPAGTIILSQDISLSQAQAQHEGYILPFPSQASQDQKNQWNAHLEQLVNAKRSAIQKVAQIRHPVSPDRTCGYDAEVLGGWPVIFNDYVGPAVYYHVSLNCQTLVINRALLSVGYVPYNNPVSWIQFAYSYYRAACILSDQKFGLLYPNTTYTIYPNTVESVGLDAVYTFQQGDTSACIPGGGGPIQTAFIGPLW